MGAVVEAHCAFCAARTKGGARVAVKREFQLNERVLHTSRAALDLAVGTACSGASPHVLTEACAIAGIDTPSPTRIFDIRRKVS